MDKNKELLNEIQRFREISKINESQVNEDILDDIKNLVSGGVDALENSDLVKTIKNTISDEGKKSGIIQKIKDVLSGTSSKKDLEDIELGHISEKGQKLLDNPIFQKKLQEISDAIHIDKQYIIKLMNHESGLDPRAKNSIGCVGLIQFCPSGSSTKTVNGKMYTLEDLRDDLPAQMDAIKDFWVKGYENGKIRRPEDLYIYNFFPVAAGKSDDFVLQAKGLSAETVANANPVFNRVLGRRRDTPLTVGDLKSYYQETGMV